MTHAEAEDIIDYGRGTRLEEAAREIIRYNPRAADVSVRVIPELHVLDFPGYGRFRIVPGRMAETLRYDFRYHAGGFSAEILGVY